MFPIVLIVGIIMMGDNDDERCNILATLYARQFLRDSHMKMKIKVIHPIYLLLPGSWQIHDICTGWVGWTNAVLLPAARPR